MSNLNGWWDSYFPVYYNVLWAFIIHQCQWFRPIRNTRVSIINSCLEFDAKSVPCCKHWELWCSLYSPRHCPPSLAYTVSVEERRIRHGKCYVKICKYVCSTLRWYFCLCRVWQNFWYKLRLLIENTKIHHFSSIKSLKILRFWDILLNFVILNCVPFYTCLTMELTFLKLDTLIKVLFSK